MFTISPIKIKLGDLLADAEIELYGQAASRRNLVSKNQPKLEEFTAIDSDSFSNLLLKSRKGPSACYELKNDHLIQFLGTDGKNWPAAISIKDYYTFNSKSLPAGWTDMKGQFSNAVKWPKGVRFYFPEQGFSTVKVMFAVIGESKMKSPDGAFDGFFEAFSHRLLSLLDGSELRVFLDRVHLQEKMGVLSRNLVHLLNHELRTPLSSIRGYAALLAENQDPNTSAQFGEIIESEIRRTLATLERLTQVIDSAGGSSAAQPRPLEVLDIEEVCQTASRFILSEHVREQGDSQSAGAKISIYNANPGKIMAHGDRAKLELAFGEVIKNALRFSLIPQVEIYLSNSDGMVIIDVIDHGAGVAPGVEDLIFLNFFQDRSRQSGPNVRKGLGIGLFLARSIVEEHLGHLRFVRAKGRIGFFRFLIPAEEELSNFGSSHAG
jgi:signal transduction histidine kinase